MSYSDRLEEASKLQSKIEKMVYTKRFLHDNRCLEFKAVSLVRSTAFDPILPAYLPDIRLEDYPELVPLLEKIIQTDIDTKTKRIEELLKK